MALFDFTKKILQNKKINVYNKGNHVRDFTYIDDMIAGTKIIKKDTRNPITLLLILEMEKINLMKYISLIEFYLKAKKTLCHYKQRCKNH